MALRSGRSVSVLRNAGEIYNSASAINTDARSGFSPPFQLAMGGGGVSWRHVPRPDVTDLVAWAMLSHGEAFSGHFGGP